MISLLHQPIQLLSFSKVPLLTVLVTELETVLDQQMAPVETEPCPQAKVAPAVKAALRVVKDKTHPLELSLA
jgi:hypothetical protein